MKNAMLAVTLMTLLVCCASVAQAQHKAFSELMHVRDTLSEREQRLQESRDRAQERLDNMKAQLSVIEQYVDNINTQLDKVRASEREIDEAIQAQR